MDDWRQWLFDLALRLQEEARLYCRWASPLEGIMDSHSEVSPPLRCYNKDRALVAR